MPAIYSQLQKTKGEEQVLTLAVEIPLHNSKRVILIVIFFSIVFAVHAALGDIIEGIEFNQYEMREHIVNCFSNGQFTPFPTVLSISLRLINFPGREIELHCTCGMHKTFDNMVECDQCEKWFHLSCKGITSTLAVDEHWFCKSCTV